MWCRSLVSKVTRVARSMQRPHIRSVAARRCHSSQFHHAHVPILEPVTLNNPDVHAPYTLSQVQEDFLVKGDPERKKMLDALVLQLYIAREGGVALPREISLEIFETMMHLQHNALNSAILRLKRNEKRKERKLQEHMANRAALEDFRNERDESENPWLDYHVFGNAMFTRLPKTSSSNYYDQWAWRGLQFGQNLIIDCSFDNYMREVQKKKCASQILDCYDTNRKNRRPFALHLCNLDVHGRLSKYLRKENPEIFNTKAIGVHVGSYLDLFDRKKLVFVTHLTRRTVKYNPDDVYIIAAHMDTAEGNSVCLKKALKENIRCAALPIDQNLKWKQGSKNLCLDQTLNTIMMVKNGSNWGTALRKCVPSRKFHK